MNNNFVLLLFCAMVHSSGAIVTPERVVNDILDSTAFNVAMFMMGWAATSRWTRKGKELPFVLQWLTAMATVPVTLPPATVHANFEIEGAAAAEIEVKRDQGEEARKSELAPEPGPEVEPEPEDSAPLLAGLSQILTSRVETELELASLADSEMHPWRRSRSCFHSAELSDWSLGEYMAHIHWLFECSAPCLVLALVYLDRALGDNTKLTFNSETCQRLFLSSLLVAAKFHDDDSAPYSNHFYADVGHVSVEELNAMEKQFCKLIDWRFYVRPNDYLRYKDLITCHPNAPQR